jgi:hypothetical protein
MPLPKGLGLSRTMPFMKFPYYRQDSFICFEGERLLDGFRLLDERTRPMKRERRNLSYQQMGEKKAPCSYHKLLRQVVTLRDFNM